MERKLQLLDGSEVKKITTRRKERKQKTKTPAARVGMGEPKSKRKKSEKQGTYCKLRANVESEIR